MLISTGVVAYLVGLAVLSRDVREPTVPSMGVLVLDDSPSSGAFRPR
ncbi:MAG TPA: hypothetical protein VHU17_15985 [Acidimicrobiales bacterium]|nr:hypothetical protein [Acidimicrobiales bacterium]